MSKQIIVLIIMAWIVQSFIFSIASLEFLEHKQWAPPAIPIRLPVRLLGRRLFFGLTKVAPIVSLRNMESNKTADTFMPVRTGQESIGSVSASCHVDSGEAAPLGNERDGGQPILWWGEGVRLSALIDAPVPEVW
jgi:hypothetical protein